MTVNFEGAENETRTTPWGAIARQLDLDPEKKNFR